MKIQPFDKKKNDLQFFFHKQPKSSLEKKILIKEPLNLQFFDRPKIEKPEILSVKNELMNFTKPLKSSYFSEPKKNMIRRALDNDSALKGWEKMSPLD